MFLTEYNFGVISETTSDKKLYLSGIFLESEKKNRNGRIYSRSDISLASDNINEASKSGHAITGELDHPKDLVVSLANISHQIVEMHMVGNDAIGKALILDTPSGRIAKSLIEAGIKLGVSSRGSGTVNESTGFVEGYELVTVDLVATPSAHGAYPKSIYENLNRYRRGENLKDLAEAAKNDQAAQKYFNREIKLFIASLLKK